MGIFGRSKADHELIGDLMAKLTAAELKLKAKSETIAELRGNLAEAITSGHFRDEHGKIGAKGVLPKGLSHRLNGTA